MIEKNTVFILGAGASAPYGFPLGRGLTQKILEMNIQANIAAAKRRPGENIVHIGNIF